MGIGRASMADRVGRIRWSALRHWAVWVSLVIGVVPALAGVDGDLGLLRDTATAHRSNMQKILTWRGTAEIEDTREDQEGLILSRTAQSSFLYDRSQEATRWTWTYTSSKERQNGQIVSTLNGLRQSCDKTRILTRDAFYRYELNEETRDGELRHTLVILPRKGVRLGNFSDDFDPMWYLTRHGLDMEEYLMMWVRNPTTKIDLRIRYDAGKVLMEIAGSTGLSKFQFDLFKGGNLLEYSAGSNADSTRSEWTYTEQDGVWVPQTFTIIWLNTQADGRVEKRIRRVRFVSSQLNKPVEAKEFSVESLGLKTGTRVTDNRGGVVEYPYRGELATTRKSE